ncbi:hypothetical protein D3C74_368350 [compost metagenome]
MATFPSVTLEAWYTSAWPDSAAGFPAAKFGPPAAWAGAVHPAELKNVAANRVMTQIQAMMRLWLFTISFSFQNKDLTSLTSGRVFVVDQRGLTLRNLHNIPM